MLRKRVNYIMYDIDGCLYHAAKDSNPESWVIQTNSDLLYQQVRRIHREKFDEVIVAYDTNRQDCEIDGANACLNRNGSFTPALPLVQNYLAARSKCPVVMNPFLTTDLFHDAGIGQTYVGILAYQRDRNKYPVNYNQDIYQHAFNRTVIDRNKILIALTHAHQAAILNPDAGEIVIDFYDDMPEILDELKAFFTANTDLLPLNTVLNLHHYEGKKSYQMKPIEGMGSIDRQYEWTARLLVAMFQSEPAPLQDAADLIKFHQDKSNYASTRAKRKHITVTATQFAALKDSFNQFRQNHFVNLPSNPLHHSRANYTTAATLKEKGLLQAVLPLEAGSVNLNNENWFEVTKSTQQYIIRKLDEYIESREKNKNRIGYDFFLTLDKISLARNFRYEVTQTKDCETLLKITAKFQRQNKELEQRKGKKYGLFTSSGFDKQRRKIENKLKQEPKSKPGV